MGSHFSYGEFGFSEWDSEEEAIEGIQAGDDVDPDGVVGVITRRESDGALVTVYEPPAPVLTEEERETVGYCVALFEGPSQNCKEFAKRQDLLIDLLARTAKPAAADTTGGE